jgi:hypothetical protein
MKEAAFYDHNLNLPGFYYPESFENIDISTLDSVVYYNKQGTTNKKGNLQMEAWQLSGEDQDNLYQTR